VAETNRIWVTDKEERPKTTRKQVGSEPLLWIELKKKQEVVPKKDDQFGTMGGGNYSAGRNKDSGGKGLLWYSEGEGKTLTKKGIPSKKKKQDLA